MRQPIWPLQRLQQLRVILVPVLLLAGEQRGRPERRRRRRQQLKTKMVASRFVHRIHACRGASTLADPQQRREPSAAA
jgi:hypothetical protein